jgi:flagellar motor switch protein FliM
MQRELSQLDILSLLKAANQAGAENSADNRAVAPWQAEKAGQFRADQGSIVSDIQDSLAKGLTQSLGAYLRVSFETTSVAVTQMTFREAVEHATGSYLLALKFQETPAVIQIEQALVFPLIDILLGGNGQGPTATRDVTEIEDHVMEGIGKIICHEIVAAWGANPSECELIGAQHLTQAQRLLSANDRVVVLQFETKMAEVAGHLRLLVPGATFNALLRKLSSDAGQGKSPKSGGLGSRLGEKMLECSFRVSLGVTAIKLPVDKIMGLVPGQICDLGIPVNQPAALIIAGRDTFDANPVRQGRKRAAQLGQQRLQSAQERTA